ncbi:uncharacterized protein LOC110981642 [Acanthaster planci]|uniref:Uncharacterized protein LOC110981642 n=1 Tax=Acanthaster planci TaxID=133434 RepID=A0A8B7YUQ7_ACAPL|nr:uncharacterized protein LOC110981642 [Acanthaster planci]XP_022095061.1 uncharacterized protein LOC110981642 [Acanthaster planci]XP_022095062.1 uncharacterized protein LOC110981642 [Acanthaster planci]
MDDRDLMRGRFRWLLVWMSDMLVGEDVHKAKMLLRDQLGLADYDSIQNDGLKLLEALERGNLIHEGDTDVLRMCLTRLERYDILETLDEYERERQVVSRKLLLKASSVDGPYFGHADILDEIVSILDDETHDHIHLFCISGMSGTGKTRLAKEACFRMRQFHKMIFVDLRELETIEAIFFAIMHAFGMECRDYEPQAMYNCLRSYDAVQHGGAVLVLDSTDHPLDPGSAACPNPTYEAFVEMLENITNLPNKRLKLLITSRYGMESIGIKRQSFDYWKLEGDNELAMESAVEMMKYHAGKATLDDKEAEELANLCGKIPLALKVVASRLQDQTVQPKDLIRYLSSGSGEQASRITRALSHLGLALSDQIGPCLKTSIESLPEVHRRNLVKLAVIPGSFTVEVARVILGYPRKNQMELQLDLQALKYRSLLESKQDDGERSKKEGNVRYSLHLLLRSFVEEMAHESEGDLQQIFKAAEVQFVDYFGKRMKKIAKMLQVKAVVALARLQDDAANYLKALNIIKVSKEYHNPDTIFWMYIVVEMLLFTDGRIKFYRERAESAKKCGQMQVYAESKCYEVYQLSQLGYKADDLLPMLKEAEDELTKLDKEKQPISVQLSLATCYHFQGDVHLNNRNWKEALPQIQKAVDIRKRYLGDHLLTARAYNSLGSAFQDKALIDPSLAPAFIKSEKEKAMDCYRKALDICKKTTGPDRLHLESPTFLMNLGTCLHDMEQYDKAVEYYQQALKEERLLGMEGTDKTCTTLKNIAMSYYEMERYDDAIPIAKKAMEGRKRILGTHPATARSIYFVGSLNLTNRNYKEARKYLDEALRMEEELWRKGMDKSIDWTRLKNKIEFLMTTLGKDAALSLYKKRFREAEKKSNQHKPKLDAPENSETESSTSSSSESIPKRKRRANSSTDSHSSGSPVDRTDGLPMQGTGAKATQPEFSKKREKKMRASRVDDEETDSTITSVSGVSIKMEMGDIQVHFPPPAPPEEPVNAEWPRCIIC